MAEKIVTEEVVKGLIADAIKDLLTKDGVVLLIDDAIKVLVTEDALKAALEGVLTKADLDSVLAGLDVATLVTKEELHDTLVNLPFPHGTLSTTLEDVPVPAAIPALPIPAEYIKNLVFRSAKQQKSVDGKGNVPTERKLGVRDVLSWKVNGETVTFVAGDGQKHIVVKE